MQKKSLKEIIMKLYLIPKGENGLPLHPIANVEECMKSYDKVVGDLYTEEDMRLAFGVGRNFQLTGENNFNEILK